MRARDCLLLMALLSCVLLSLAPRTLAQGTRTISGSVGATSDFVFRGISYSQGEPAAQASLDLELASRVYAGAFLSSTDPNPGRSPKLELDFWAGRSWDFSNGISGDLRFTHYMYPDDPRVADYDRDEITATFGAGGALFLAATYSSNADAIASAPGFSRGDTWAFELSARRTLSQRWSVSAGVGRYLLDNVYNDDYSYWSAQISANFQPWELHLAALGSDSTAERLFGDGPAGERVALTMLYRFSTVR